MKNQALFSWKDKSKKLNCCLLQFLFGALRVKSIFCRTGEDDESLFYFLSTKYVDSDVKAHTIFVWL